MKNIRFGNIEFVFTYILESGWCAVISIRNNHLVFNNQSANLRELITAGISSFKIEGRLKDLSYVKTSRRTIDSNLITSLRNALATAVAPPDAAHFSLPHSRKKPSTAAQPTIS